MGMRDTRSSHAIESRDRVTRPRLEAAGWRCRACTGDDGVVTCRSRRHPAGSGYRVGIQEVGGGRSRGSPWRRTRAAFPPESASVTFWARQDQQDTTLSTAVLEAVNTWLLSDWPLRIHVSRLVPAEHRPSRSTLERLDLWRLDLELPAESRPYRWYQPP